MRGEVPSEVVLKKQTNRHLLIRNEHLALRFCDGVADQSDCPFGEEDDCCDYSKFPVQLLLRYSNIFLIKNQKFQESAAAPTTVAPPTPPARRETATARPTGNACWA